MLGVGRRSHSSTWTSPSRLSERLPGSSTKGNRGHHGEGVVEHAFSLTPSSVRSESLGFLHGLGGMDWLVSYMGRCTKFMYKLNFYSKNVIIAFKISLCVVYNL